MITPNYESTAAAVAPSASQSGVSWAAIFAGALAAGVLSLLLFMLGTGLGLSAVSAWTGRGAEGSTMGWSAVVWLMVTQLLSAAVGGYLAGRLRTKWQGIHTDEVYFRDTAHGFLAWALATVGMVVLAGSVLSAAFTGAGKAASMATAGAAAVISQGADAVGGPVAGATTAAALNGMNEGVSGQDSNANDMDYWISTMLRPNSTASSPQQQAPEAPTPAPVDGIEKADEAASPLFDSSTQVNQGTSQQAAPATTANASKGDATADTRTIGVIFSQALKTGNLPEQDADYVASIIAPHSGLTQAQAKEKVQTSFGEMQKNVADANQVAEDSKQKALDAAEEARKAAAHSMLWMFVALLIGAFIASLSATYGGRQRNNV